MFYLKGENWETLFVSFWDMFKIFVLKKSKSKKFYGKDNNYRELVEALYSLNHYDGKLSLVNWILKIIYVGWIFKMLIRNRIYLENTHRFHTHFFITNFNYDLGYYFKDQGVKKLGNRVKFRYITYNNANVDIVEDFIKKNKVLVSIKRWA